jgi:hypothetical protein
MECYLTVEYVCENEAQRNELFAEIRKTYKLAVQDGAGVKLGGWDLKPIQERG